MADIRNNLVQFVKFRTANSSKIIKDNESQEANIFADDEILAALELSLRAFNMRPVITYFKWDDEEIIDMIADLLVTYASYMLLSRQSLLERGREFQMNDSGINFIPPPVSDMTFAVANEMWVNWEHQVRILKESDSFYWDFVKDPSDEDEGEDDTWE